MTPATSRTASSLPQSELRRRAILEAALRVIAEGGVESVTHRRVAAEAGVPLGSTTYYFASREDLLREAFRQHASAVLTGLDGLAETTPLRTASDLVSFLVELVGRELADREGSLLVEYELIVRAARDPELAREVKAYERSLTSRLGEVLERLGVTPALEAARILIALVRAFELECLTDPPDGVASFRRRLEAVVAGMMAGVAARLPAPRSTARPRARRSPRRTARSA
jgi:TetR/AcrR family transcriptional regulator, regulator of biofilm formation and stress response